MKSWIIVVASIFILFMGLAGAIAYHELAHGEIYRSYGSEVRYSVTPLAALTYGSCNNNQNCISEQNWNDIIGYHVLGTAGLMFCAAISFILLNYYKEVKEHD